MLWRRSGFLFGAKGLVFREKIEVLEGSGSSIRGRYKIKGKFTPQIWENFRKMEVPQTGLPVGFYLRKKVTGHAGGRAGPGADLALLGALSCVGVWDLAVLGVLGWVGRGIWLWWARWAGLGKVVVSVFWLIDLLALFGVYAGIISSCFGCQVPRIQNHVGGEEFPSFFSSPIKLSRYQSSD